MLTSAAPLFGSLLALAVAQTAQAADYSLVKQYSGDTFFDDWIFTGHYDNTTNGGESSLSWRHAAVLGRLRRAWAPTMLGVEEGFRGDAGGYGRTRK